MRRTFVLITAVMALTVATAAPIGAASDRFPDVIPLPDGFFPEGIVVGEGTTFYAGSLVDGAIVRGDLRTGDVEVWVEGVPGQLAIGMDYDRRTGNLYVAGGPTGTVRVYDTTTGDLISDLFLGGGFVNDAKVTPRGVYLTNSFVPELYEVPLASNGAIEGAPSVIPLSGDFVTVPGEFNANGIEYRRGTLIVVNAFVGSLYAVDRNTGVASEIDLGGEVVNGDGLVLVGSRLYAVVGGANEIVEIRLNSRLTRGVITDVITDSDFDVPTTADRFRGSLYAVNAKFSTPPTPDTPYEVVRVDR